MDGPEIYDYIHVIQNGSLPPLTPYCSHTPQFGEKARCGGCEHLLPYAHPLPVVYGKDNAKRSKGNSNTMGETVQTRRHSVALSVDLETFICISVIPKVSRCHFIEIIQDHSSQIWNRHPRKKNLTIFADRTRRSMAKRHIVRSIGRWRLLLTLPFIHSATESLIQLNRP